MPYKLLSSQFIKTVFSATGKSLKVAYADKTKSWIRPEGHLAKFLQDDFADVVKVNAASLKKKTVKVLLKWVLWPCRRVSYRHVAKKTTEHSSPKDPKIHYTALEVDKKGRILRTRHFWKEESK